MNKANLNNLLSLLCMEEAGTESKEQDEYEPYYSHKKLTIIRYQRRDKRSTSLIDNYGGRHSKVQEKHWYPCIRVQVAWDAESDIQCIPRNFSHRRQHEESTREDSQDPNQIEPERSF